MQIAEFIAGWAASPFGHITCDPWDITGNAPEIVAEACTRLTGYTARGEAFVHPTATIEDGATIKGPTIIGPGCFISSSALIRGGCYLATDVILGPAVELKTSFMFDGSKCAHLNFVGDSILGADVNVEAGAMIANYRNELADKHIRIRRNNSVIETGTTKFGALIGDGTRIGANAVVAPGAILDPNSIAPRLSLTDQYPHN